MANYYFGANRGGNGYSSWSVATSTTGKEFELFVNGTNITDKETVFYLIEQLQEFVVQSGWPPA